MRTSSLLRPLQAEPFSFVATKIRIGCGRSLPRRLLQAGHSSLPTTILAVILNSGPEITNRCTLEGVSGENLASIPKSGPEIKNRCSLWVILEGFLAAIPKSGPEIKNHCTLEGVSWQKPAVIPKSELEFKNRCSRCLVAVCRRNRSSSRQRRIEQTRTSSLLRLLQAEPFSFAATKNRIGRGHRSSHGRCRRNHSPLRQRKLESDADIVAATAAAGETILRCIDSQV